MTTAKTTGVKRALADALEGSRGRTLDLLAPLSDAELARQVSPLMSPLVWDLAHVAYFEELWLVRRVGGGEPLVEEHDELYDAFRHARSERGELPILDPGAARRYAADIRARTLDVLERVRLDPDDRLLADGAIFWNVLQHEQQHRETMLQTLQLREEPYPLPAAPRFERAAEARGEVLVEGGTFVLGTDDGALAYDNERPAHAVELPPFWIDVAPVTNADYLAFVEETGAEPPQFWRREGDGAWSRLRFGLREDVPPDEPVQHVSWHEASAYARWAGKRLPTEEEWERAASRAGGKRRYPWGDDPPGAAHANLSGSRFGPAPAGSFPAGRAPSGILQAIGDVWEWTSSSFRGYPGFDPFPYAEYSEVFFGDEYRVLRGGSWATEPEAVRTTFRNWDYPIRRQIFAGFRCARDA